MENWKKVCYGYTHNWQIPYGFLSSLPWMGKVYKVFIHVHIVVGVVDHCWRLLRNKNETIHEYEKYIEQPVSSLHNLAQRREFLLMMYHTY